jgi:hypothetical protein
MTSDTTLIRTYLAMLLVTAVGFVAAGADPATIVNGTKLSTPAVILVAVGLGVLVGVRGHRRAGAAIALLPCLVSTAAIIADGDLAHDGLTTAEIGLQLVNVAVIWSMLAISVARLRRGHSASARSTIAAPLAPAGSVPNER